MSTCDMGRIMRPARLHAWDLYRESRSSRFVLTVSGQSPPYGRSGHKDGRISIPKGDFSQPLHFGCSICALTLEIIGVATWGPTPSRLTSDRGFRTHDWGKRIFPWRTGPKLPGAGGGEHQLVKGDTSPGGIFPRQEPCCIDVADPMVSLGEDKSLERED